MLPFFRSKRKDATQTGASTPGAAEGNAPSSPKAPTGQPAPGGQPAPSGQPASRVQPAAPPPKAAPPQPVIRLEPLPSSTSVPDLTATGGGTELSPEDRRRAPRYTCQFAAEMDILFPEETFRPRAYRITILDVSSLGARMFLEEIDPHHLRLLMSGLRYCRLNLHEGEQRRTIYGRIVWVGQHNARGTQLGLAFDDRDKNVEESRRLLIDLAQKNPAPATPPV